MSLRIYVDFKMPPDARQWLENNVGEHELIFPLQPMTSVLAKPEPDPQFQTADIAFGQPSVESVQQATNLRWLSISSSGMTRYDNDAFRTLMQERQTAVTHSATVFNRACALHAFSFMLAEARKLPEALQTQVAHSSPGWPDIRARSTLLEGDSVLIVGHGAIGRRLVELLQPLGMQIKGYRRRPRGDEGIPMVTEKEYPFALASADHVINILPESDATRHFFNARSFATMKYGAVFYNIGRGATVDQDALAEFLLFKKLKAAWLDVTTPEPLPRGHMLLSLPNCHITPHIAGGHHGEHMTLVRHFIDNLRRFEQGETLVDRVM
ncbi:D-2-hydroxyacid dehydrogenase [Cerasicoccus fimbriatus]|uniref:D-2-hydroxyacid dehydrogenase n=1 Tax=Cerasicoccus fimbriatus TaxID=3014554 RepID=UPI0022B5C675|nr:D-2-hydroxyacid dehydrogenase [Cerasicoccus sp. TK19100]